MGLKCPHVRIPIYDPIHPKSENMSEKMGAMINAATSLMIPVTGSPENVTVLAPNIAKIAKEYEHRAKDGGSGYENQFK